MTLDSNENKKSVDNKREYRTDDLIVYWDPSLCKHVRACILGLPQVFNVLKRPWVKIDAATPEEIIKTIDKCPTGALTYRLTENSKVDPSLAKGFGAKASVKE